jgi:hypothetical protein
MEQMEVISWKTLDALKQAATHVEEIIGDLDTHEQMAVFCSIEEDYLELYYSELEGNYIRHFENEEEMLKYIELRKTEFGEDDFDSVDYYDDENGYEEGNDEDFSGYKIRDEDEEDEF